MSNIYKPVKLAVIAASALSMANYASAVEQNTLYYKDGACSFAPHVVINELGLDVKLEKVDLGKHVVESTGKDFYKINAKGGVPALELTDGNVITENAVVMQYLADSSPNGEKMLPKVGSIERYKVLEFVNFISMDLHKLGGILFHGGLNKKDTEKLTASFKKSLSFIDKNLTGKQYLVGENFTIADAYLMTVCNWFSFLKVDIKEYKNLAKYYETNKKLPSVAKAMAEEGLTK